MAITEKEMEQWKLVLRILKGEMNDQLEEIIRKYEEEEEEDVDDGE